MYKSLVRIILLFLKKDRKIINVKLNNDNLDPENTTTATKIKSVNLRRLSLSCPIYTADPASINTANIAEECVIPEGRDCIDKYLKKSAEFSDLKTISGVNSKGNSLNSGWIMPPLGSTIAYKVLNICSDSAEPAICNNIIGKLSIKKTCA